MLRVNIMKNISFLVSFITASSLFAQESLLNLDLESLAQIQATDTSSTLIKVIKKYSPSTSTTITQKQIQESGARTLDELLEIYVPEMAYMYKVDGNQIGMNGIISDRNNKILLLVNGRVMNVQGRDGGAITERFFSLLGDIKEIQVLSGPGSTIYGPGAIAGVISITTFNSKNFKGLQANTKLGYGENFASVDLKYATKFSNELGMFIYAGVDKYKGVEDNKLINKFAFNFPNKDITAYQNYPHKTVNLNSSFNGDIRKKLHIQLNKGNFEFWSRYTKSSLAIPTYQSFYISAQDPSWLQNTGTEDDQWCSVIKYTQKYAKFETTYSLSYILSELEKRNSSAPGQEELKQNEDNTNLKILTTYHYSTNTDYAIGIEYSKNRFKDYEEDDNTSFYKDPTSWSSDMYSLYAEAKNDLASNVITILDVRIDKHTYTDTLYSGRAALIYKITPDDTLKLSYSHSVRHGDEVDLYRQVHEDNNTPDTESIDRIEFIYNKSLPHWENTFRTTLNNHHIVAYNDALEETSFIGSAKFYTLEGIAQYHTKRYDVVFSHLFTSLTDFTLKNSQIQTQNISASAYGYGHDFANWNRNITKIRFDYNYNNKLKFISSLRVFWGLQGGIDMANYNKENFSAVTANPYIPNYSYYKLPVYDNNTKAFGANAYLNMSLQYKFNRKATVYLHGYNLLGLFNEDINKRNYFQTTSNFFDEAPAVAVSLNYKLY